MNALDGTGASQDTAAPPARLPWHLNVDPKPNTWPSYDPVIDQKWLEIIPREAAAAA